MKKIYFPQYKRGREGTDIVIGKSILDYAREIGVEIASECGGLGKCGRCIVRVERGKTNLNEKTENEKKFSLGEDERLACQAKIIKDNENLYLFIKDFGEYSILTSGKKRKVELEPFVYQENSRLFYKGEDIGLYEDKIYGLAIDIGTTTLVLEIVDLESGKTISTIARKNPQISYGNDVISRIEYVTVDKNEIKFTNSEEREKRLKELQRVVVSAINESLSNLEREKGGEIKRYIYDVVIVGNSTMRNIFFDLDISSLGIIPYESSNKNAITKISSEIGLEVNPQAKVYGPPLIGGHVGTDILADILVTGMYKSKNTAMIIDIGTNAETTIGNSNRIIASSAAAGGAFEGATIRSGVGAIEGAIKNIRIKDGKVEYETIGDKSPVGICGSGLIDILSELLNSGIMTKKAKLKEDFLITDGIGISQKDIYQLITAKAGLRTGQDLLIKYYGIDLKGIDKIYLSGAFGSFVNIENSIRIGLLPPVRERIVKIGNGSLEGAKEMLISQTVRKDAEEIAKKIEHVKPNEREKDFNYLIASNMYFE